MTERADDMGPALEDEPQEESLGDTIGRLTGSVRELVQAELALAKTRGTLILGAAQYIAILGVAAFIIAFGMIVTLMIGAVLALAPLWGLGLALLAVTGGALLAIALCGLGVRAQIIRIKGYTR